MNRKISLDEAMRASIAVVSDYENTNHEKINKVASSVGDTALEKVAGIFIDKPTLENCEDFVRKFMYNELSFFPRVLELNVNIIPQAFNKAISDHIDLAQGMIQIKIRSKNIEIPFIIRDGELDPFDVVQIDGQRAPYSRENLQRIIINLDKQLEQEENGAAGAGGESPYLGTEEYSNPSTSPGFMGDVLSIRDSQSLRKGNGTYVTAFEEYSDIEKMALFGKKASEDFLGMGLHSNKRRDRLEDNVDKAREEVEKEKPTTKAPAGKVEGEKKEEKVAIELTKDQKENVLAGMGVANGLVGAGAGLTSLVARKSKVRKAAKDIKDIAMHNQLGLGTGLAAMHFANKANKKKEEKVAHVTDLNSLLDKTHNLSPITDEQCSAIAEVLNKKAYLDNKNYLEKLASEEEKDNPTRKDLRFVEAMSNFKFDDISRMEHGDIISIPEMKNDEFSLTPAMVFKKTSSFLEESPVKTEKFVITLDGRIKVLNGDKMLCKKSPEKKFNIPRVAISQLQKNDRFFVIKDNEVSSPYEVMNVISERTEWDMKSPLVRTRISAMPIGRNNFFNKEGLVELHTLEGKKFDKLTSEEFVIAKQEETGIDEQVLRNILKRNLDTKITAVDPNEKVFKISGSLLHCYKSEDELNHESKINDAGLNLDKVAFSMNTVKIECCDRRAKVFNLVVEYKDTNARLMNLRRQNFNRIGEGKLKAILRILKFEGQKLTELMYKAKNEPRCTYPIPNNCTIEDIKKIEGGNLSNVSAQTVKRTINNYINPNDLGKTLATAAIGGLVADAALTIAKRPGAAGFAAKAFDFMGKVANESKEISSELEKFAQKIESDYMLDMAKVASLSAMYHEKVAHIVNDKNNSYPNLKGLSEDIVKSRPVFEKMAYDLTSLKVNQGMGGQDYINPALVSRAINTMSELYKTASVVNRAIKKENLKF